jgi:hypothetical protein
MTTDRQATTTTVFDQPSLLEEILADAQAAGKDTTSLSREDRSALLVGLARKLGLNPLSGAVMFLKTNGRETLYVTKSGTDQIAAREKLKRETIRGPEVLAMEGKKVVFCQVRASHPDGRSEVSTATLLLADIINDLMKCETKAKRRATLSVCGLGLLAEDEIETIPGAQSVPFEAPVQRPAVVPPLASLGVEAQPAARLQVVTVAPVEPVAEPSEALVAFRSQLARVNSPASAVTLWLAARGDLTGDEKGLAWGEIAHRVRAVWPADHAAPASTGGWLKNECAKADAAPPAAAVEADPEPPTTPPAGKRTRKASPAADATSSQASSGAPSDGPAALAAVPAWMGSRDAMRDHLASKTHARAVEASVRQHGRHSRAYLDLAARRVEALTPADADGARITLASCTLMVERWANEGPRPLVAQKAKVA